MTSSDDMPELPEQRTPLVERRVAQDVRWTPRAGSDQRPERRKGERREPRWPSAREYLR